MTERERILAILNGRQPDQLPWCADLAYWISALEADGAYPEAYRNTHLDDGLQKLHRDLGAGFYLQGFFPFETTMDGIERQEETKNGVHTTVIHTPKGDLREVSRYSQVSYSWGVTEHFIKDIADLRILRWIYEHTAYLPAYDFAQKRYDTIGNNGVVLCYMPKSPMMELVAIQAGIENFTYMALDDPDELEEIMDVMEQKCDEACQIVLDSPAECIMIPENITSESVGKTFYHRYMERYHRKWTERIRRAGKHSFVHQDGTVRGLVGELSESGFQVVEAITPLPVGDIAIENVASLTRDETVIWGGIPGGFFTESISDEEFDRHVIHCIEVMTREPRYVLGVADQVVPGSLERRIRRVRELVDQYGQYR